jgi:hypothetical protein
MVDTVGTGQSAYLAVWTVGYHPGSIPFVCGSVVGVRRHSLCFGLWLSSQGNPHVRVVGGSLPLSSIWNT